MPIFLKKIKRDLSKDEDKVEQASRGEGGTPPNVISRKLSDYKKLKVLKLDRAVHIGLRAVDFTALIPSENISGRKYRVAIRWNDVLMSAKQTDVISVPVRIVAGVHTGKVAYYKTPTIAVNPVKLLCSCDDFRHRFSHELDAHDALIGEPKPYIRQTPPWEKGGRPYANSTSKVGMCKHVYSLILHLKARGLIKER